MPRSPRLVRLALGGCLASFLALGRPASAGEFAFFHENVMGTSLELRVRVEDSEAARRAEGRVLGEIDRLARILSNHDASSEFRRWQALGQGPTRVSPELFEMLRASDRWRESSGGAFDPRIHVLTRLWSDRARQGRTPDAEEIAATRTLMAEPAWRLDFDSMTAERLSECPLTLDAIAKGYIVERACEAAMRGESAVHGLLLNVGGDLRVWGDFAGSIGIVSPFADTETAEPLARVEVRDRAVATSGASQRGLTIRGRRYSHVFDPRTGGPAEGVAGATVIAEGSADADALATILNVLSPRDGLRLVASVPGAECLIVAADGEVSRSPGWGRYEAARTSPLAARQDSGAGDAKGGDAWGEEFELLVNFEINKPEEGGRRYRRPYVAVWVEDSEGFPVRNLLLWVSMGGSGPFEWLPDLKRWYRADQARKKVDKTDMVQSRARPTRPPGKYSVTWDGKDDKGKPLAPGEYTITIESAREHGTYQVIRKKVKIERSPFAEELQGNDEIGSASVEYRRKTAAKP